MGRLQSETAPVTSASLLSLRLLFVSCLAAQTLVLEKPNWTDWTEAGKTDSASGGVVTPLAKAQRVLPMCHLLWRQE